jgi:hypothetical protein
MDDLRRCAFETLQDHVLATLRHLKVKDLIKFEPHFIFERFVAELTLERLPEVALQLLAFIAEALAVDPLLEA